MKDKRKKKDRTWAEAARLVRTAPRPPPARPAGPAARPAPARGCPDGHLELQPPPRSLGSCSLLFCRSGLARGPPGRVRARAEGRSGNRGEPRARRARDRPGHFSRHFAVGAQPCLLQRVNFRALGPTPLPLSAAPETFVWQLPLPPGPSTPWNFINNSLCTVCVCVRRS